MGSPILSLIIPVYNKAPFLRRCLDSVAKQMRDDVEVIVIDDASTDGSWDIMFGYMDFMRIQNPKNEGVSATRNCGIVKSHGKAIAFLDADDALEDGALDTMVAYAQRTDKWPIIQFGQSRYRADGSVVVACAPKGSYTLTRLPKHWQMVWNKVYSREFIRARSVRFREDMGFGEDEMFNIDLMVHLEKIWHAPGILVQHWLDDMNSICRGGSVDADVCRKLYDELSIKINQTKRDDVRHWLIKRQEKLVNSRLFVDAGFKLGHKNGKHDIVYMLRGGRNEELRYSLRSVEENFAYNRVWFAGGCPAGIEPDEYMPITQDAPSKWENVRNMLVEVCKNDDITKDFWLFNDDFFVLEPCDDSLKDGYYGTIEEYIEICRNTGEYRIRLEHLLKTLKDAGLPTLNYAIHRPILVNRKKALKALEKFPEEPMFRALYGNYAKIGGEYEKDYKIRKISKEIEPGHRFVSTQDDSFKYGMIGRWLRDRFCNKSRFEK